MTGARGVPGVRGGGRSVALVYVGMKMGVEKTYGALVGSSVGVRVGFCCEGSAVTRSAELSAKVAAPSAIATLNRDFTDIPVFRNSR